MKTIPAIIFVLIIILTGCRAANSTAAPVQPDVTGYAVETLTEVPTEIAVTVAPTSSPLPSATPAPTATPDTDIWRNCREQNPEIKPELYKILGFGTSACKFQRQSPDGVYMVYAALDLPGREMLLLETMGKAREIDWLKIGKAGGCGKCTIRDVQWGKNNTLLLDITATTSGPAFVYLVTLDGEVTATLRGDFGQWNADKSAFYTAREKHWFLDAFGVYDFNTGKSFNLEGYNGIKVAGWSGDGVFLSVRPFTRNGDAYCNQPAYAARVDLTADGPKISVIKKAGNLDFDIDSEGNVSETLYKQECSELMG